MNSMHSIMQYELPRSKGQFSLSGKAQLVIEKHTCTKRMESERCALDSRFAFFVDLSLVVVLRSKITKRDRVFIHLPVMFPRSEMDGLGYGVCSYWLYGSCNSWFNTDTSIFVVRVVTGIFVLLYTRCSSLYSIIE